MQSVPKESPRSPQGAGPASAVTHTALVTSILDLEWPSIAPTQPRDKGTRRSTDPSHSLQRPRAAPQPLRPGALHSCWRPGSVAMAGLPPGRSLSGTGTVTHSLQLTPTPTEQGTATGSHQSPAQPSDGSMTPPSGAELSLRAGREMPSCPHRCQSHRVPGCLCSARHSPSLCAGEPWCRAPAQDHRCCRISAHVFLTDRWIAAS